MLFIESNVMSMFIYQRFREGKVSVNFDTRVQSGIARGIRQIRWASAKIASKIG